MSSDNIDSDYLIKLARNKSQESRANLSKVILDLFGEKEGVLTDRERTLMFGILQSVVMEIEMSVRQSVATRLAGMDDVPDDLVVQLANDDIAVAFPMLSESGLLRDAQLIDVIRMRTMEHQLAVAMRREVSESVSSALVETGHESVIVTLLKNPNARISDNTMEYLVQQSQRVDSFQEPILHRGDLQPDLAKRMFLWVSAALREHIVSNFKLDKSTVDDLLEQIAHQEIASSESATPSRKADELARILKEEGLVTVEMLLTALREGEVPLFVSMFCKLSNLRQQLVMRLLFEPGGQGLAIACRGIALSEKDFIAIYRQSQKAKSADVEISDELLAQLVEFYNKISQSAAADVLRMWRRGSDYLGAIRELQITIGRHG